MRIPTLLFLLLTIAHQLHSQSPKPQCSRYDDAAAVSTSKGQVVHYVEVCAIPNQESKPALSVVFTSSPDRKDSMRIYSFAAGSPLQLDGIYVERNGQKQFILHNSEIEWANGTKTPLDNLEPKKKSQLSKVVTAAFKLLKMAAENRRLSIYYDQDRLYRNTVIDFFFNYQLNADR